ncbi:MAG: hypothetical protein KDJ36_11040, partial [Hyphomicrobiaceae bacterium]|nr:hypothetical protein [Hyphomicrobiaceae bacterium]
MPQGPAQYTPQQILEAGQRAEADGRFEYANQFYHHLAEHYPKTPEARFAREGIQRLSQRLSPDVLRGRDGHQPSFQPTPAFRDDVTVPGSARQRPSAAPRP